MLAHSASPESPMKRPCTSIGFESLDTILYPMGIPLVSPTISEREILGGLPHDRRGMEVTKKILSMALGTSLRGNKPVLAPQSGKPVAIVQQFHWYFSYLRIENI